jgi:hypothetical protein
MKFCGMCGAALPAPIEEFAAAQPEKRPPPAQEAIRRDPIDQAPIEVTPGPTRANSAAPAYTGGAFRLMGHEVDPGARSLDYLLEDDEEGGSKAGSWLLMFLIALALAGGLGYWHYRNGGWKLGRVSSASPQDTAKAGGATPSDNTVSAPAAGADQSANEGAGTAPATAPQAPTAGALSEVRPQGPPAPPVSAPEAPGGAASAAPAPIAKSVARAPAKPAAAKADASVKAEDSVTLGEKYIYGRGGVPQNCERGLKMVRPAADAFNGKAMITMGALYATGHCVARDLPTAYRYFALALRKDPDNPALKQNAEMVWGQMTQSERQQAIRLTQ